ncbi:MAG TPA: hypothetical protein VGG99_28650 [Acetobacteraceae bacterium]
MANIGTTRSTRQAAVPGHTAAAVKRHPSPTAPNRTLANRPSAAGTKSIARTTPNPPRGNATVSRALAELAAAGKLTGQRSEKISARVDPGVMQAAAARLGLRRDDVSAVVNAALAVAAAPDRFKTWLRTTEDTLPDDFELAI